MSILLLERQLASGHTIQVCYGDITLESTYVIVNAANTHLTHHGGLAGALVRRGGQQIQDESNQWAAEHGGVPVGQVAVTKAGRLAANYIIHAVGPIWRGGKDQEAYYLAAAIWNSLQTANELNATSISIPALSSGLLGFPKDQCAQVIVSTIIDFCTQHPLSILREIRLTNIDLRTLERMYQVLSTAL